MWHPIINGKWHRPRAYDSCRPPNPIRTPRVYPIPEASPTLPLAASLGLTFSYNVTVGIPVYIEIAKIAIRTFPV
jgi:hypothetical protein